MRATRDEAGVARGALPKHQNATAGNRENLGCSHFDVGSFAEADVFCLRGLAGEQQRCQG